MSEERDFPRLPREVDVEVIKLQYPIETENSDQAMTMNIANKGICFLTETEYSSGDVLNLKISLNGLRQHVKSISALLDNSLVNAPLSVVAKVVWSKQVEGNKMFEVGASFENVDGDEYEALNRYLRCLQAS